MSSHKRSPAGHARRNRAWDRHLRKLKADERGGRTLDEFLDTELGWSRERLYAEIVRLHADGVGEVRISLDLNVALAVVDEVLSMPRRKLDLLRDVGLE